LFLIKPLDFPGGPYIITQLLNRKALKMASKVEMSVQRRSLAGKGAARETRRSGLIPAVIYGSDEAPELISVEPKEIAGQMKIPGFKTRQFELVIEGGKRELSLAHAIQFDKLTDAVIHIDFLRINPDKEMSVEIPFAFKGSESSPGVKAGGVLNIAARSAEIVCRPADMVDAIEIDVSMLDVAESLHSDKVALPAGLRFASRDSFPICTISAAVEEIVETAAPIAEPTEEEQKKAEAEKGAEAKADKPDKK